MPFSFLKRFNRVLLKESLPKRSAGRLSLSSVAWRSSDFCFVGRWSDCGRHGRDRDRAGGPCPRSRCARVESGISVGDDGAALHPSSRSPLADVHLRFLQPRFEMLTIAFSPSPARTEELWFELLVALARFAPSPSASSSAPTCSDLRHPRPRRLAHAHLVDHRHAPGLSSVVFSAIILGEIFKPTSGSPTSSAPHRPRRRALCNVHARRLRRRLRAAVM